MAHEKFQAVSDLPSESEFRFRQLAELIPNLAWMANADGWIHWYNRRWYEYSGTTPQDMEGWGWTSVHHPDYQARVIERWTDSIKTGQPFEMEFPLRAANGQFRMFLTRVQPLLDQDGKVVQWFGTNTDIDDQRRAAEELKAREAQLRAVLEATPECVKLVARDGTLLLMNPAGLAMIECESEDSARGACVYDLIEQTHRTQWREYHHRVCQGERLSWEFELVGLKGARRWMETHAVPLAQPNGELAQLAVTREITGRKRLELEREQLLIAERAARSEAEHASRVKDQFLATLSHELRTPLHAILGWSQLLTSGNLSEPKMRHAVDTIERNVKSQSQLIDDLLDMSAIVSGKVRIETTPVVLSHIVQAAMDSSAPAAQAKGIAFEYQRDTGEDVVNGDPGRLQQIVWNLLSNAIKFTPSGGCVQVEVKSTPSQVQVQITDTGVGIQPEFIPFVFERFRQGNGSITRKFGGLGLGLSIVKQLVDMHHGEVAAYSAGEGLGATFTVSFPRAIDARVEEATRTSPAGSLLGGMPSLADLKVLVVDDEPDARALVQRILEECGATVITAADAARGLELVRLEHPEVIVSDIGMPDMDGYEFIKKVRQLREGEAVPAIAVTAFARPEDRQRSLSAGYQSHLCKPMQPTELVTIVAAMAGRN